MAIQHVKGDFFDHEFGAQHREFGFHGSAPSGPIRHDGHLADHPADEDKVMDHYAHGGEIHGEHHPHGHHVVHTEHKPDGRIIPNCRTISASDDIRKPLPAQVAKWLRQKSALLAKAADSVGGITDD